MQNAENVLFYHRYITPDVMQLRDGSAKTFALKQKEPTKDTVEPSPTSNRVSNILTVMSLMMLDPITSGMQTLYLLTVNALLPQAKQILLQGTESHSEGR